MRDLLPWEKNWLRRCGWSEIKITQLTYSDDQTPVEYLTGLARFAGLRVAVSPAVLIPRVETEGLLTLIQDIFTRFAKVTTLPAKATFLDVGTGSGILAVCLARQFPGAKIIATDNSQAALDVARDNVTRFRQEENIQLVHTHLLEEVEPRSPYFLVANLPYIPSADVEKLDPSVLDYEPRHALDGGEDGFRIIHELLEQVLAKKELPLAIFLEVDPSHTVEKVAEFDQFTWEAFPDENGLQRYLVGIKRAHHDHH